MSPTALATDPTPLVWTDAELDRLVELGVLPANHSRHRVRLTRDQYRSAAAHRLFDGRRVQLIRGEVLQMAAMLEPHVSGVALTQFALQVAFGAGYFVRAQAPLDVNTANDPEPDVVVVPGGPRTYSQAPSASLALVVVEVADSTLDHDITVKAELYATAGIKDYWVLDVENRRLHVFRDPRPLPDGGASYHDHHTLAPADSVSPLAVPTAVVRVSDLLP